jgi:hypothetical protein
MTMVENLPSGQRTIVENHSPGESVLEFDLQPIYV